MNVKEKQASGDLEKIAVYRFSVQRSVDINLPIGVVHCLDHEDIFHVACDQSEIDLAASRNERKKRGF